MLRTVLQPKENWEQVRSSTASDSTPNPTRRSIVAHPCLNEQSTAAALASDSSGRVYVQNPSSGRIDRILANGSTEHFATVSAGNNGICFGPDGRLYVAETAKRRIIALNEQGHAAVIAEGIRGVGLTVTHAGNIYVTESNDASPYSGKVWLIRPHGEKIVVAEGLNGPSGNFSFSGRPVALRCGKQAVTTATAIACSPAANCSLASPITGSTFPIPPTIAACHKSAWIAMDIPMPPRAWVCRSSIAMDASERFCRLTGHQLAGICFGGADMQTLYVSTGNAIYRRKLKSVGLPHPPHRSCCRKAQPDSLPAFALIDDEDLCPSVGGNPMPAGFIANVKARARVLDRSYVHLPMRSSMIPR